jgi:hypothetical protein
MTPYKPMEASMSASNRLSVRHAPALELLNLIFEMEAKFLVQLLFYGTATEQRAETKT